MNVFTHLDCRTPVAWLTLNRPDKRNALKRATLEEIATHVRAIAANESLRCVVLQSTGDVFCAGMDLGEMQERASSPDCHREWQRDSEIYRDVLLSLCELPVPVIAKLQGPALAGGVGLVVACDLVVATDSAYLMLPEPRRGITAAMVTPLLIQRVGMGPAGALLLSGERWNALRCQTLGLFHDVVPPAELDSRVDRLLEQLLTGSREALAMSKAHLWRMSGSNLREQLAESMDLSARARETADAREGLQAFLEKRNPGWQVPSKAPSIATPQ
jgi:methylglutaconyl-CoA hydratase